MFNHLVSASILTETPAFFADEPPIPWTRGPDIVRYWEALLRKHHNHPWILVELSNVLLGLSPQESYRYKQEAMEALAAEDIEDEVFFAHVNELAAIFDVAPSPNLSITVTQPWKPTRQHEFPSELTALPPGIDEVFAIWKKDFPKGSALFRGFLSDLAIETNHIEGTFFITKGSTQDLIRRGVEHGSVAPLPRSDIKDATAIKSILNDILVAYECLDAIVTDPSHFTIETICDIHARLVDTARFHSTYIPPGQTRDVTNSVVFIHQGVDGSGRTLGITCCPPKDVLMELDTICQKAQSYLKDPELNPFAVASWLHSVIARCHPFNDGNGRLTRLVASIPLLRKGYPPITIPLERRDQYLKALNKAYYGFHEPLIECFTQGMKDALDKVVEVSGLPGLTES